MDALNVQVMVQARPSSGERLTQQIEAVREAGHADRFVFFASLDLSNVGPGSGTRIAAQLEEDVRAGAVGIGEIMKSFGLTTRKADGTRLALDDPERRAASASPSSSTPGIPLSSSSPSTTRTSAGSRWRSSATGS